MTDTADPAIGYTFALKIDKKPLGNFTKVDGLAAKYETKQVVEGGENGFVHNLRGRLTYENVRLTRAVDSNTGAIAEWFSALARKSQGRGGEQGTITAFGPDRKEVATWQLLNVYPVRYQGPSFDASGSTILTETLELGHDGFTVVV